MLARHRLRQVVNALGLATPLGLALAQAGGARRERRPVRPDGLIMTSGHPFSRNVFARTAGLGDGGYPT